MQNRTNITIEAIEQEGLTSTAKKTEKLTNGFDKKNYLNVKLNPGQKSKELKIRLLPIDKESNTPFKKIKMHTLKVDKQISSSGWKSYVCLSKTDDIDHEALGHKCPFCELNYAAYKKSTETTDPVEKKRWQDISLSNVAQDVVIVRCIERGAEEDGPKFWKFNIHKKQDDPYNVLLNLYKTRKKESEEYGDEAPMNIFDLYEGKDLIITIKAEVDENGKTINKTSVTITDCGRCTPLSKNQDEIDKWVNDEKKWSDVFVAKPYEYLSIILDGKMPYYDKETNTWVEREFSEERKEAEKEEMTKKSEEIDNMAKRAEEAVLTTTKTKDEEDLPF